MNTTKTLSFSSSKTYILAAAFVIGNILLPQLAHQIPQGGLTWLPIYFFTLLGSCLYGWRVGLLTSLLSPAANSLLFGMPAVDMVGVITVKSALIAVAAGILNLGHSRATLLKIMAIVLGYQCVGTLAEWAILGDFTAATQDFRIGLPGIAAQIAGVWAIIALSRRFKK